MAEQELFDGYYRWLGIPANEQPAHYYRLLGIANFEENPDVIEAAADRQMTFVRTFQNGQHVKLSQKILNELSEVRVTLLTAEKKSAYDAALRQLLAATQPAEAARPVAAQASVPLVRAKPLPPQPPRPPVSPAVVFAPSATGPQIVADKRSAKPTLQTRRPRLLAGLAVGCVALVGVLFLTQFSHGTGDLVIESSDNGVEVELRRDGVAVETVTIKGGSTEIKIKTGDYEVVLTGEDKDVLRVDNNTFTLTRGGRAIVKISRRKPPTPSRQKPAPSEQRPPAPKPPAPEKVASAQDLPQVEPPAPAATPAKLKDWRGEKFAKLQMVTDQKPTELKTGATYEKKPYTWTDVPAELQGMWYQRTQQPRLLIAVEEPGIVLICVTSRYGGGGNRSGDWFPECTSRAQLLERGWEKIADLPDTSPHKLNFEVFARKCEPGERFLLRTEKYTPPGVIVPNASLITPIETLEVE